MRDIESQEGEGGLVRALFLQPPLYNWCLTRCLFQFCAEKKPVQMSDSGKSSYQVLILI